MEIVLHLILSCRSWELFCKTAIGSILIYPHCKRFKLTGFQQETMRFVDKSVDSVGKRMFVFYFDKIFSTMPSNFSTSLLICSSDACQKLEVVGSMPINAHTLMMSIFPVARSMLS